MFLSGSSIEGSANRLLAVIIALPLMVVANEGRATASESTRVQRAEWTRQASAWYQEGFEAGQFHGGVIIMEGDHTILERAAGVANSSTGEVNTLDTKFQVASLTKVFTQVAIMRLVDEGKVDLDASLATYRPAFKPSVGGRIKIRHLLAMTSGLPRELTDRSETSGVEFDEQGMAGPFLDSLDWIELGFRPGSKVSYSNVGYWMLGAVIEAVTKMTYGDYVKEAIFDRLGMKNSGFGQDEVGVPGFAVGQWRGQDGTVRMMDKFPVSQRYSSGGIHGSPRDLQKFGRSFWTEDLLSDDAKSQIYRQFGRGRYEATKGGGPLVQVGGLLPGYRNALMLHIDEGYLVVNLNNLKIDPPNPVFQRALNVIRVMRGDKPQVIPGLNQELLDLKPLDQDYPDSPFARNVRRLLDVCSEGEVSEILDVLGEVTTGQPESERQSLAKEFYDLRERVGDLELLFKVKGEGEMLIVFRGSRETAVWLTLTASKGDATRIGGFDLSIRN